MNRISNHDDQWACAHVREAVIVIYSSTAAIVQLIKLAIFFITLSLPAHSGTAAELNRPSPIAALHEIERPHSNPHRNRTGYARQS
jgi:hypothetical protein